jgi:putative intracellular protease/amidase
MLKKLLVTAIAATALQAHAGNVLVVLSDSQTLDLKDGKTFQTGFYLNELMQPVKMLLDAGHQVTFATPLGKAPTMDANSNNVMFFGGDQAALDAHLQLLQQLQLTDSAKSPVVSLARVAQQGYGRYDAVYVPGGHAPMQDLLTSPSLGQLLNAFHAANKTTALVCHGPIALLSAMPDASGFAQKMARQGKAAAPKWTYSGYQVTVFSNDEEEASKAQLQGGAMKFYPQTALQAAGLKFSHSAQLWQGHMVTDRELVTGQNPASAPLVGQELLRRLK